MYIYVLTMLFKKAKVLNFDDANFINFLMLFVPLERNFCLTQCHEDFILGFPFRNYIILYLIFRSIIQFKLFYLYDVW